MDATKLNPRHEKNRHHLATVVVAVLALMLLLALRVLELLPSTTTNLLGAVFGAVLLVRTVIVELGMRRKGPACEMRVEHRARRLLRKYLGLGCVEDLRSQEDEGQDEP